MAPAERPVGDAAKLWKNTRVHLAKREFDSPVRLASDTLTHCQEEGVRYGQAAASLVLALVEFGKATQQASDFLKVLDSLGLEWGEVAQLLHVAARSVDSSTSPAQALDDATQAASSAGAGTWALAAALSIAAWATLQKDGPADARERMEEALKLTAEVGIAWGETGALVSVDDIHLTRPIKPAELQALAEAPAQHPAGQGRGEALLWAAAAWLEREDRDKALQAARDALAQFREVGARELEATALRMVARVHAAEGSVLEALQAAGKAAALFRELGHRRGEAASLVTAAQAESARYSTEDAAWKAAEAVKIFRQLGLRLEQGSALEALARCHLLQQDFAKGLDIASQAVELAEDLGDDLKQALRTCLVSKMHSGQGSNEVAVESAKNALTKLLSVGDITLQLQALDTLTVAYQQTNSVTEALSAIQDVEEALRAADKRADLARVLLRTVELYRWARDAEEGLAAVSEAANLYSLLGDEIGAARVMIATAQLYLVQDDFQRACRSATAARNTFQEQGRSGLEDYMVAAEIIVGTNLSSGLLDEAAAQAKETLRHCSAQRHRQYEAQALMLVVSVESGQQQPEKALASLRQVPPLLLAMGDKRGEADAWLQIAKLHSGLKEPDLSVRAAEEARTAFRKLGDKAGIVQACQLVAEANFSLVPNGFGSARDAVAAAQEVLEAQKGKKDKQAEAHAMKILANAQLMSQTFVEAHKTAFQAEELFTELRDDSGAAAASLLTAGAHLGQGVFEEALSSAREARDLFRQCGDLFGEETAEDFLEQIEQYKSGQLSRLDFRGFALATPDESKLRRRRRATTPQSKLDLNTQNIWMFGVGNLGERENTLFFEKVEFRSARPHRTPSQSEAVVAEQKPGVAPKREQVLYTVRWVKTPVTAPERDFSPSESDSRRGRCENLRPPGPNFNRCAPSDRLGHAYEGNKGV